MTGLHRWYLQGRDDADEDLDLDQFDAETLARRVFAGTPIRDLTVTAMTDLLAIDPHDGSEREWIDEHEEDLEEDGVDPAAAYKEWRRGWIDAGAHMLEAEIVEAMNELIEELDDDDDDDAGGRPTYGDYQRTGVQDCQNVWDGEEIDIRALARQVAGKPEAARRAALAAALDDMWSENEAEIFETWTEQNAGDVEDAKLDVAKAFAAWKAGFRSCQERQLEGWVRREEQRDD